MKHTENNTDALLPGNYLAILTEYMRSVDVNPQPFLRQCNIRNRSLQNHNAKIPASQFTDFLHAVHEEIEDVEFWFGYGDRLTIAAHGSVGQALMNCENLQETLNLLIRFYQIQFPPLNLSYDVDEKHCIVQLNRFPQDDTPEFNFGPVILFTTLTNNIKKLLNRSDLDLTFYFDYEEPNDVSVYRKYLGSNIQFDKPFPQIRFPIQYLNLPLVFSNPVMQKFYVEQCEQLLKEMESNDDTVNHVKKLILATPGEFPNLDQVAEKMNISIRTLRRRLNAQNTSFQEILDEIREQIATKYLTTTHLTVEKVAQLVGYSDTSNFRRAFQKWTGLTPSDYRRSIQN